MISMPIDRSQLKAPQLQGADSVDTQVDNSAFLPCESSAPAKHHLSLNLEIDETPMQCNHPGVEINGKSIDLFPKSGLRLTSDNGDLIPLDRDLLRDPDGNGYWDITLSPGRVWSELEDGDWSRAALPFQLSNIFENDTHHGIATFLYRDDEVSRVFYQVVAETKTFLCPDNLQTWGWLHARPTPLDATDADAAVEQFRAERNDQLPLKPLTAWFSDATRNNFDDIDNGFGSDSTMVSGLVIDDEIFSSPCRSSMGDYPYPRAMKFGIWSATKTAFCSIACLRIAHITGQDPRVEKVCDLLPEARNKSDWSDITVGDCLNMASGIGTAAARKEPRDIFADYLLEEWQSQESDEALASYNHYHAWFLAPSQHEKNLAAFACPAYPWPPGTVARYRDQDLYIAGAALDAILKRVRGPDARIWAMVCDEIYTPARLRHAVKFHTIETDPAKEVPLSDAGLLLSMDNIARLGQLILDRGRIGDEQILDPLMLDEFFDPRIPKGLPTGIRIETGEVHYHAGTWHLPYRSNSGEDFWIPTMRGYGGQIIQTLPNGTTAFRFGFDSYETEERYDALKLVRLSDKIRPF